MRAQKLVCVEVKLLREKLHIGFYRLDIVLCRVLADDLFGVVGFVVRANIHHAAVHSGRAEITDGAGVLIPDAEHDYAPSRLIFSEEITGLAADDHERLFFHVLLHVNARAVARRAFHKYLSVAHSVACRVADVAVNSDRSVVHSVADSVLRVAVNRDVRACQIRAESVPGNAVDFDVLARAAASRVALSEHIFYRYLASVGRPYFFIQLPKREIFCIYFHHAVSPFDRISNLFSFANAASCGASLSSSQSTVERSVRSRIRAV